MGLPAARGLITYEDPDNEISGSTLAVGGGWGYNGAGGTVNGTTFNGFANGYVIFQNAADLSTSFRQSLNYTRVLTHEIGHAIGLGHTQTDGSVREPDDEHHVSVVLRTTGTPVPPAIGPDDLAGLNFIYPSGASSSCTYSINPTSAPAAAVAGSGSVSVTTQTGCGWTAVSNSGFLGISSGSTGSGSGSVGYTVAANAAQSTAFRDADDRRADLYRQSGRGCVHFHLDADFGKCASGRRQRIG